MSERSEYTPGEFCWVDLATPDMDASAKFYGELMGWGVQALGNAEETHGYSNFTYRGKAVAGVGGMMGEDQPPAWSNYISVTDADETAGKVKEAGGTVLIGPFDIPGDSGRMAVCQDAEGAFFSLWQAKQFGGAELVNEVGAWTWNQLVSRDLEKAKKFYGEVFGWSLEQAKEAPPDSPFFMWQVDDQKWEEGLAGAMTAGEDLPAEVPPHWQVYFAVGDADAAIATTTGAGGANVFGPEEIPVGRLAVLVDPQGANFAIIQPNYPEER